MNWYSKGFWKNRKCKYCGKKILNKDKKSEEEEKQSLYPQKLFCCCFNNFKFHSS